MSKFFRSPSSRSSSNSSTSSSSGESKLSRPEQKKQPPATTQGLTSQVSGELGSYGKAPSGLHKDLVTLALLEEKCLNDVRNSYADAGRNGSESKLRREAKLRFQGLSEQLSQLGLVAPDLAGDRYESTRQQYRSGLNLLSNHHGNSTAGTNGRPPMRRMITSSIGEDVNAMTDQVQSRFRLTEVIPSIPTALNQLISQQSVFGKSRYRQDFEELGVLGKGGYGIVYQCRHKLDGVQYAVKKVPLSEFRHQQILARGQQELDSLLSEIRTLAQLDHPNIVRYYNGWLDYIQFGTSNLVTPADEPDAELGAPDNGLSDGMSFGRLITESEDQVGNVLFEDSVSRATIKSSASTRSNNGGDPNALRRTASHGTRATVSDEDVESISRASEPSFSAFTDTDGVQFDPATPQLALHMQMALHPLTLSEFLAPEPPQSNSKATSTTVPPLKHCFHLKPSIRILLALLEGIGYLHRRGIVHRDIKPGNVFLAPNTDQGYMNGSAELSSCSDCQAAGQDIVPDLKVRIGDFGLVTALAKGADELGAGSSPVGTELYRPGGDAEVSNASPGLDIFALGIVAFELLWPFGTRMERHEILQALKQGRFPRDFGARIGDKAGMMEKCIRDMLKPDYITVEDAKKRLVATT